MKHFLLALFSLLFIGFGVVSLLNDQHTFALIGFLLAVGLAYPTELSKAIGVVREAVPLLERRADGPRGTPADRKGDDGRD